MGHIWYADGWASPIQLSQIRQLDQGPQTSQTGNPNLRGIILNVPRRTLWTRSGWSSHCNPRVSVQKMTGMRPSLWPALSGRTSTTGNNRSTLRRNGAKRKSWSDVLSNRSHRTGPKLGPLRSGIELPIRRSCVLLARFCVAEGGVSFVWSSKG